MAQKRSRRRQQRQKERSKRQKQRQKQRSKRQSKRQEARKARQQTRQRQRTKRQAARQKTKRIRARERGQTKRTQYEQGFGPGSGAKEIIQTVGGIAAPLVGAIPGVPSGVADAFEAMDFAGGGDAGSAPPAMEDFGFQDEAITEEEPTAITDQPWFLPAIGAAALGAFFLLRPKKKAA